MAALGEVAAALISVDILRHFPSAHMGVSRDAFWRHYSLACGSCAAIFFLALGICASRDM